MDSKKFIGALLITLVVMACSGGGEGLTECAKDCLPICLKEDGATISIYVRAKL